jgi:hypothetical protein
MAKEFAGKLNRIQSERAAKAGLPENGVSDAVKAMVAKGEYPKDRTYVREDSTGKDGIRTVVYHNIRDNEWVFQQSKGNKALNRFTGATEDDMYDAVFAYGEQVKRESDPEYKTCKRWLRESKWGRAFATFECASAWHQLQEYVPADGVTIENLDKAFTTILDLEDISQNWHRFEQKRDRLAREAQEAESADTPHENLPSPDVARKNEDIANKALSTKELRHRAIFGGKVVTVPSTGTVRQPR